VCYNRCHGNAVKVFSALWDNINQCFTALDFFRSFLTDNSLVSNVIVL
jgi:hypothetical protein